MVAPTDFISASTFYFQLSQSPLTSFFSGFLTYLSNLLILSIWSKHFQHSAHIQVISRILKSGVPMDWFGRRLGKEGEEKTSYNIARDRTLSEVEIKLPSWLLFLPALLLRLWEGLEPCSPDQISCSFHYTRKYLLSLIEAVTWCSINVSRVVKVRRSFAIWFRDV